MPTVTHFVTSADVVDDGAQAGRTSCSARFDGVLSDGRTVVVLDDRGWSSSGGGQADPWSGETVGDIEATARMVVGPDEPFDGKTHDDMAVGHWEWVARHLRDQRVEVVADDLPRLRHDVVLSERLRRLVRP